MYTTLIKIVRCTHHYLSLLWLNICCTSISFSIIYSIHLNYWWAVQWMQYVALIQQGTTWYICCIMHLLNLVIESGILKRLQTLLDPFYILISFLYNSSHNKYKSLIGDLPYRDSYTTYNPWYIEDFEIWLISLQGLLFGFPTNFQKEDYLYWDEKFLYYLQYQEGVLWVLHNFE